MNLSYGLPYYNSSIDINKPNDIKDFYNRYDLISNYNTIIDIINCNDCKQAILKCKHPMKYISDISIAKMNNQLLVIELNLYELTIDNIRSLKYQLANQLDRFNLDRIASWSDSCSLRYI
jgi:hypothetical protein